MNLIDKRAIKITELSEELEEAKKIISSFIWPSDMDDASRKKHIVKCAKFAGCTIPVFSDSEEKI